MILENSKVKEIPAPSTCPSLCVLEKITITILLPMTQIGLIMSPCLFITEQTQTLQIPIPFL